MRLINKCLTTDIYMADGFSDLGKYIENCSKKILWIFDSNTARMAKPTPELNIILDFGEASKDWKSVEKIISKANEENFSREDIFIAMGGGVVLDTAAFAASIYKRGCTVIFIPTTLLAMTDAAIGGKTGVNFMNCKNCIGTFYPAKDVIICTECLQSLSEQSFVNGLGEIIKTAFLSDNENLLKELVLNKDLIMQRDDSELKKIVEMAIEIKCGFVEKDPKDENGTRKILNLGHTFAHALESLRRMNVSHGQAVAWGTCKAATAAKKLEICSPEYADSIIRVFSNYGFDVDYKINFGEWNEYNKYLQKDKKIKNNELKFLLPKCQGEVTEIFLNDRLIRELIIEGPEAMHALL